jgi:hypothetical protein
MSGGGGGGGGSQFLPTRKMTVSGLAGALSVVLVWLINTYWPPAGKPVPAEVASAMTTIISFVVGYFVPDPATS